MFQHILDKGRVHKDIMDALLSIFTIERARDVSVTTKEASYSQVGQEKGSTVSSATLKK